MWRGEGGVGGRNGAAFLLLQFTLLTYLLLQFTLLTLLLHLGAGSGRTQWRCTCAPATYFNLVNLLLQRTLLNLLLQLGAGSGRTQWRCTSSS
jgi:hypothetical protein